MNSHIPKLLKRSRTFIQPTDDDIEHEEPQVLKGEESATSKRTRVDGPEKRIVCTASPCKFEVGHIFDTVQQYEKHIARVHTHVCLECGRNFPSARWLDLHIHEVHNPLRRIQMAKGEATYTCVLQQCKEMFYTHKERNKHCRDKHGFEQKFDFRIIRWGISSGHQPLPHTQMRNPRVAYSMPRSRKGEEVRDGDTPMLNASSLDTEQDTITHPEDMEITDTVAGEANENESESHSRDRVEPEGGFVAKDVDIESLTHRMSSLSFVPSSVKRRRQAEKHRASEA